METPSDVKTDSDDPNVLHDGHIADSHQVTIDGTIVRWSR